MEKAISYLDCGAMTGVHNSFQTNDGDAVDSPSLPMKIRTLWRKMMNCFVASAFGHEDVDAIYDRAIRPVLRELRLQPFRVDRVEHNEDIDDKILKLIDKAQLCIADLTYARPSVYYEAGYAFGSGRPVIYLTRRDHFHSKEDDLYGNFRVHFDLQMKNIIQWTEPTKTFMKRLRNRLKHVLRPIYREQQALRKKSESEDRFASISQDEQLRALLRKGVSLLRAHGFKHGDFPSIGPATLRMNPGAHFYKIVRKAGNHLYLLPRSAIKKSTFQDIRWLWNLSAKPELQLGQIASLCVLISLRKVRSATLADPLSHWTPISDRIFTSEDIRWRRDEIPHSAMIAVIDGIRTIEDFADRFRPIVKEFEERQ